MALFNKIVGYDKLSNRNSLAKEIIFLMKKKFLFSKKKKKISGEITTVSGTFPFQN